MGTGSFWVRIICQICGDCQLPKGALLTCGRLVGFGPGVPFKSSDFNDLPQTRPARRHHRYIAAFVFTTSRTSDERTRSCHRHAGKDVYSGVSWILRRDLSTTVPGTSTLNTCRR